MDEMLKILRGCPYLEGAELYEAEGEAPLIRVNGGTLERRTDGTPVYAFDAEIEVFGNAEEICLWLLEHAPQVKSVSAPQQTGGETGIRYVIRVRTETEGKNGQS